MIEMIGHAKTFEDLVLMKNQYPGTTQQQVIVVLVSFTPCHPMSETRAKKEEKTASAIWAHGVKKSKGEQNFN